MLKLRRRMRQRKLLWVLMSESRGSTAFFVPAQKSSETGAFMLFSDTDG